MTGIQTESIDKKTTKVNINDVGKLILNDATELTIAIGVITMSQKYHTIDTEADAATDDLDTINGGTAGEELIIRAVNDTRAVVVKNATGNLRIEGDMTLDNSLDTISLIYTGTYWVETGRANNGA